MFFSVDLLNSFSSVFDFDFDLMFNVESESCN